MSGSGDFWSRRKARVAAAEAEEERAHALEAERAEAAALEEKPDAEILEELGLPDPDTMQAGDDFSVFMKKAGLPERIRRRALRKLWLTNPVLANVDGLIDYGEDFTDSARVVENMQTAYQVGKGMLRHVEEMARKSAAKDAEDAVAADLPAEEDGPTEMALREDDAGATPNLRPPVAGHSPASTTLVAEVAEAGPANLPTTDTDPDVVSSDLVPPVRRRLRFEFET